MRHTDDSSLVIVCVGRFEVLGLYVLPLLPLVRVIEVPVNRRVKADVYKEGRRKNGRDEHRVPAEKRVVDAGAGHA